jgi:Tol biopolymer transport system component/DNA-binding winged helix-turn-helix (wHTH) protein
MKAAEVHTPLYYEFGPFRLSPGTHHLYRNGDIVLLPPKEFDLLLLLLRNAGKVMDRESLIQALWPDTIVEEANLNVHISALRKVLGESSGEQRYIETLPRLGYRFFAPVKEVNAPVQADDAAATVLSTDNREDIEKSANQQPPLKAISNQNEKLDWVSRHRLAAVTLPLWLLAVGLLGILLVLFFRPSQFSAADRSIESPMNVVPLTTYPGRESQPAFSPDGNQVAFVWSGEKEGDSDIYVRLVDGGNWVRLTSHVGDDVNPVWSPDGRTIAFYRSTNDGDGVFLVPSLGGAERKLTETWANRFGFGMHTWLHWSPGGKWLVLSDKSSTNEPFSLFLFSPETGEKRRLTSPPASVIGDCSPAFSPDGKSVAFVRVISAVVGEVYLVSADGGEPEQLTFSGEGISNLTWTPDGREIVFSSRYGGKSNLLRIPFEGGTPQWLSESGNSAQYPAFSLRGNRLAWVRNTDNTDIFRITLNSKTEAKEQPANVIPSTAIETSPRYSPDGKRIAFVSNRSGSDEIWVSGSEGENPVRLTSFRGPLVGSPSWSPDGRQIVFDCRPEGNADIFTISSEGGQPRRLTSDAAEDIVPSWSIDGRWIYFTSNRSGRLQVWKTPVDTEEAIQVTEQGGFDPVESPDGQWLYFTADRGSSAIWRMPTGGGKEMPLFDFHQKNYSRMWAVTKEGIYFAIPETSTRSTIKFFSFATNTQKTVAQVEGYLRSNVSGITLSPNGKSLLLPLVTQRGSDLMMIENFR